MVLEAGKGKTIIWKVLDNCSMRCYKLILWLSHRAVAVLFFSEGTLWISTLFSRIFFRIILHDVRTDVNLLPISFVFLNQDSVVKKKDLQMNRWFPLFTLVVAWVITKRLLNWTFWTCKIILKVFHWSVFCDNDLFIRRFEVQRLGAASPKQLVPAKQTWKSLQFNSKIHTPAQRRSLPV